MNKSALKSLSIENLRGSTQPFTLDFEKGKKLTIVYGENGTGKTTICDSLELLADGRISWLEERGLGRAVSKFWPSVGKTANDVRVTLADSTGLCSITIGKSDVSVDQPALRPRVSVLRRAQLTRLLEAQPAVRFEAIRSFVDVGPVEASEKSLRELIRNLKQQQKESVARIDENREALQQHAEAANCSHRDPLEWADEETKRSVEDSRAMRVAVLELRTSFNEIPTCLEAVRSASSEADIANEALRIATEHLRSLRDSIAADSSETLQLLQAANVYLTAHPAPAACPLCEGREHTDGLQDRVEQRIAAYNELQQAMSAEAAAKRGAATARERHEEAVSALAHARARFESGAASGHLTAIQAPVGPCPADLEELGLWVQSNAGLPEDCEQAEARLVASDGIRTTLEGALTSYRTNVRKHDDIERLLPRLEQTLDVVEHERRSFTDTILREISTHVAEMYERVHPGEQINRVKLELDPSKTGSLNVRAEFEGHSGVPPQAYFSQSHLDTLGLCITIALAARDGAGETILVLDDVLASVDEPHVDRLILMLYDEAVRFRHCVITTHYRPWKEKLRWGWLENGQCHFVELKRWSSADGVRTTKCVSEIERLRRSLGGEDVDAQAVCSKAGVVLEAVLDFLTLKYECSVPRKTGAAYTLGELLPAIDKKLKAALRVERKISDDGSPEAYQEVPLGPLLDEIHRIAQVRNVLGAHFNALSFHGFDDDAIEFAKQVLALAEAIVDPETGWPQNGNSGSYWATPGQTRRLHPLRRPR